MREVLIITGACGVGKSTIAREWAKSKQGATVECDFLTEWIYNEDFPRWTIEEEIFVAKLAAKIAIEYLEYGMSTTIENVWTPKGIEILVDEIQTKVHIVPKVIWLFSELSENLRRDQQRISEDQMGERVDIVNRELADYSWPEYLHKIDTTKLTIVQTLTVISSIE